MGGVVVGPRASDLILPITMAVENRLTVDQLAQSFVVYPSLTGSLTEAARAAPPPGLTPPARTGAAGIGQGRWVSDIDMAKGL